MRPAKTFQGRDLFGLQFATDPQIRPDGRAIAYVRLSFDIMTDRGRQSIWLIDAESGEQTPLVTGGGSHCSPRWSPNGDRLAYVSTAEDGRPQLFVRWLQSGQTAKLADLIDAPDALTLVARRQVDRVHDVRARRESAARRSAAEARRRASGRRRSK